MPSIQPLEEWACFPFTTKKSVNLLFSLANVAKAIAAVADEKSRQAVTGKLSNLEESASLFQKNDAVASITDRNTRGHVYLDKRVYK